MTVRLHSTLSGRDEPLVPGDDGVIGIYACGPTVYSRIHIGNARPFVVFSVLKRYLERRGMRARLVINVTDVNDKIYDAARAEGIPSTELAERCTRQYFEDTDLLGLGQVRTLQHLLQQLGLAAEDDVACTMLQGWTEYLSGHYATAQHWLDRAVEIWPPHVDPMLAVPLAINIALGRGDVATALAECERRDTKGLYKRVRSGEVRGVSGVDAPYESPTAPDLVVGAEGESVTESVRLVVEHLRHSGVLGSRGA